MPPADRAVPGSPLDWLARSRGDLALARAPLPEGAYREDLCYHAQQAAEKALKAVYVDAGRAFRYVHDLEELVTGPELQQIAVPEEVRGCLVLSAFASEARYPSPAEPVTEEELREAVAIPERVVRWAASEIEGG